MFIIPQRVVTALMGFFAVMVAFSTRASISFAITEMVNKNGNSESSQECFIDDELNSDGENNWVIYKNE